jgi:tetratricopeptide (TPR) repeat protein
VPLTSRWDSSRPVVSGPLGAAHLKLGRALAERGKLSEARQALQTALRWDPRLAGPYSELARLAFAEKNFQECIDLANRALALESSYAEALGNRGACFSALGQNTAALKDLDRAILKLPRSASLRMTRAGISESLGDCRKVAEDTDLAVAIDPGLSDSADRLLAQCRHRGDRQR